jgi:hypothetical protein
MMATPLLTTTPLTTTTTTMAMFQVGTIGAQYDLGAGCLCGKRGAGGAVFLQKDTALLVKTVATLLQVTMS